MDGILEGIIAWKIKLKITFDGQKIHIWQFDIQFLCFFYRT